MASAVVPIRSSGRSPRRTSHSASIARPISVTVPTATSISRSWPRVSLTSDMGKPITSEEPAGSTVGRRPARIWSAGTDSTRYWPPPERSTVE
jgi:hypothetical protein